MDRSISVIYSTATGHTEFVVDVLVKELTKELPTTRIIKQRAEVTQPGDLKKSGVLILACGSWNTGNTEGQLSPYMHDLLTVRAVTEDLKGIHAAAIGLGDERYFYTARSAEKLTEYLKDHGASLLIPTLKIINDPFDQEKKITVWATELASMIKKLPSSNQ
jgi:flavodoxin